MPVHAVGGGDPMIHGLLWIPLLLVFVLLTALGWLERRRQRLFLFCFVW